MSITVSRPRTKARMTCCSISLWRLRHWQHRAKPLRILTQITNGSWTLIREYRALVPCEVSKKFASGSGANLQLQHQKGIWCELVQSGVMLSMTRCGLGEVGPPECPTLRPSATSKRWESYRNPHRKDDALRSLLFLRPAREAALAADLIMAASK